ncbi:hypothetical protein [Massilia endophytica]|uniref:hypothetical protein n=1 Tax=Massilia endophytica TaxID=2899220 RepID=UPI001E5FD4F2|nr:hypothetical protein [Massilia endophytica]UGQ46494.1 hypothetical protein LSQ66_22460 [Massilia endophytica]
MMRTLTNACVIAAACMLGACHSMPSRHGDSGSASQPQPSATGAAAAEAGLKTLAAIVNDSNFARLGFNSREEVQRAKLGAPMAIYHVRLDALRAMPVEGSPDLLTNVQRTLYPVEVGERVACAVFVTQAGDGYRATDMGNAAVARALTRYRRGAGDFVVKVPALQAYFVGRREEGKLMLTPVLEDNRVDWKPGVALPADRVIHQLQKLAEGYNGLPQ